MCRGTRAHFGLGALAVAIGSAVLTASGIADAQVGGAIQYPPTSVGEDAQPPPPALMVPQIVSPRRIELDVSGSSEAPAGYTFRLRPPTDTQPSPEGPSSLPGTSARPPSAAGK
jgi:hypothetical protein